MLNIFNKLKNVNFDTSENDKIHYMLKALLKELQFAVIPKLDKNSLKYIMIFSNLGIYL